VASALGNIGLAAAEAIPDLLVMFETGEPSVQASAVRALAKIAPGSRQVTAAIAEAFENEDRIVRDAAGAALQGIPAIPGARERIKFGDAVLKTIE
jgi:HEAT repeat protein